jgi:hypothetical protein
MTYVDDLPVEILSSIFTLVYLDSRVPVDFLAPFESLSATDAVDNQDQLPPYETA